MYVPASIWIGINESLILQYIYVLCYNCYWDLLKFQLDDYDFCLELALYIEAYDFCFSMHC